jgi:hypothetical protein
MIRACIIRGLDITAGNVTLPRMMSAHPGIKDYHHQHVNCPLHPWPSGSCFRSEYGHKINN